MHINGGRIGTGLEAVAWAREVERLGAGEIVLTSMDADGTQDGYDLEITAAVSEAVSIPVVASGGAGCPEHLADAIQFGKADAALAASIFHFGEYTIQETKRVMAARGSPCGCVTALTLATVAARPVAIEERGMLYSEEDRQAARESSKSAIGTTDERFLGVPPGAGNRQAVSGLRQAGGERPAPEVWQAALRPRPRHACGR